MSVLSDDEFLDTEPYVENEDYWIQAAEREAVHMWQHTAAARNP